MKIQKNIAATLRSAMKERDMTLVEFADEIGIARSSLQGYLKEHSNPRADTIELLSRKLNILPTELISGPESPPDGYVDLPENAEIHPLLTPALELCRDLSVELLHLSDLLKQTDQEAELK